MVSRRALLVGGLATAATASALFFLNFSRPARIENGIETEAVASNLTVPWSITFLNQDEAIFTERPGSVKHLTLSSGRIETIANLDVAAVGEGGLHGVENIKLGGKTYLFIYHTYREQGAIFNKVIRAEYNGGLTDMVEIIAPIPGGRIHNGGRIKVGPDNNLYITTGEGGEPSLSQRIDSLGGKILRLTLDGKVPKDNPFNNPVYAYGLRNPQGIAWHPETKTLYCTDHGPSGEGLRRAHDEINVVKPGENYGWPHVIGDEERLGMRKPVYHSGSETWAPSGCCFHDGRKNAEYKNSFFFAALRGTHLHRVEFSRDGERVVSAEKLLDGAYGRLRDVVQGPDGNLYVLTSNRDGRGAPAPGDDRIIRVIF
ncbi:MAG: PQQ-dependent sugar dehydrogenase [Candidatus Caldarchaeum sp.]